MSALRPLFDLISTLFACTAVFFKLLNSSITTYFYPSRSWIDVQLDCQEFENTFKDSGYWDYLILAVYDNAFRLYGVYSLFVVTDFSIIEKASWLILGYILWPLNSKFFFELKSLGEFFFFIFFWLITFFFVFFFIYALLSLI